jgi:hypothetical protein
LAFRHPGNQRERPFFVASHEVLVCKTLNYLSVNRFRHFGISAFRHLGNQRARPFVIASHEVPVCKTPNQLSVNRFRHFGVSAPGKPKGKNPRLCKSRNLGSRNSGRIWTVHQRRRVVSGQSLGEAPKPRNPLDLVGHQGG